MAINLTKGSRINLAKEAPALKRLRVGLGWKPNETDTGFDFDLDVTAFGLQVVGDKPDWIGSRNDPDFMVFYGNHQSIDGAIVHSGDNRTGAGDGDDESITIDLSILDKRVDEISFIVTIDDAITRRQNFGQVPKSHIALYNDETGDLIARYDLGDDFSNETAVQFGSVYKREDGAFACKAVGAGDNLGLAEFVKGYGGNPA